MLFLFFGGWGRGAKKTGNDVNIGWKVGNLLIARILHPLFSLLVGKYIRLRLDNLKLVQSQWLLFHRSTFSCCWMFYHFNYLKIWNHYLFHHTTVIYLTSNTWLWRQYGRLHVLFVILYRIYGLKKGYCLITSTNYFINQQMLNIKGLK